MMPQASKNANLTVSSLELRNRLIEVVRDPGEVRSIPWSWLTNSVVSGHLIPGRARTLMLKALGIDISLRGMVRPGVYFRSNNVKIGDGSTVNIGCIFDNRVLVEIGRDCGIGIGVSFITSDHDTSDPARRAGEGKLGPIRIGDGCFIGSRAVILCGVTVGEGAVIAAGSVVLTDCDAHSLYAGVPARKIRDLA